MGLNVPRHLLPWMFPRALVMLGSSGSAAGRVLMVLYFVPILSYWVFCVLWSECWDAIMSDRNVASIREDSIGLKVLRAGSSSCLRAEVIGCGS
jgi:hypothetical protein